MGNLVTEALFLNAEDWANIAKRILEREKKSDITVDKGVITRAVGPRFVPHSFYIPPYMALLPTQLPPTYESPEEVEEREQRRAKMAAEMSPRTLGWHFMEAPYVGKLPRTRFTKEVIRVGEVLQARRNQPIELCVNGMHASEHALDAIRNIPIDGSAWVARVEVWSNMGEGLGWESSKFCGRYRKVLWMTDADKALLDFAIGMTRLFRRGETTLHHEDLLEGALRKVMGKHGNEAFFDELFKDICTSLSRFHPFDDMPQPHLGYYLVKAAQYLLTMCPYKAAAEIYRLLLRQHRVFHSSPGEFENIISKDRARLDAALMALAPKEEPPE